MSRDRAGRLPPALGRGRRAPFAALVVVGAAQAGVTVWAALLAERAVSAAAAGTVAPLPVLGLLVAAAVVAGLLRASEWPLMERAGQSYVLEVRDQILAHLLRVPARTLSARSRGGLLLRFVGDVSALRQWVGLGLGRLAVSGPALLGALVALVVLDPVLGAACAAVVLVSGVALGVLGRPLRQATRRLRSRKARLAGEVNDRLAAMTAVQSAGATERERRRSHRKGRGVADAALRRAGWTGAVRAVPEAAGGVLVAVVVAVGVARVGAGQAEAGLVVAGLAISALVAQHLRALARVEERRLSARVAAVAAERVLALPTLPEAADGLPLRRRGGRLDLVRVGLGDAVHEVSGVVERGRTVALVGPNGSGKSTLLALAARLEDPDRGQVLLDGQDLRSVTLDSVRTVVGVAGPDVPLLRGSLRRSVTYRDSRVADEELRRVARLTGLDDLLRDLPDGWDTDIGEGGRRLSSGQRARVALARAVLGGPDVLVLDEVEAALDGQATAAVLRVLSEHRGAALVATHRWATAAAADEIWHLETGRVVAAGPPEALLAPGTRTAALLGRDAAERGVPEGGQRPSR